MHAWRFCSCRIMDACLKCWRARRDWGWEERNCCMMWLRMFISLQLVSRIGSGLITGVIVSSFLVSTRLTSEVSCTWLTCLYCGTDKITFFDCMSPEDRRLRSRGIWSPITCLMGFCPFRLPAPVGFKEGGDIPFRSIPADMANIAPENSKGEFFVFVYCIEKSISSEGSQPVVGLRPFIQASPAPCTPCILYRHTFPHISQKWVDTQ